MYFFRNYLARGPSGTGHCVNLSPCWNVTQYNFATPEPQQIERMECRCKSERLKLDLAIAALCFGQLARSHRLTFAEAEALAILELS